MNMKTISTYLLLGALCVMLVSVGTSLTVFVAVGIASVIIQLVMVAQSTSIENLKTTTFTFVAVMMALGAMVPVDVVALRFVYFVCAVVAMLMFSSLVNISNNKSTVRDILVLAAIYIVLALAEIGRAHV